MNEGRTQLDGPKETEIVDYAQCITTQSVYGSNSNEGVLYIPQTPWL